MATLVTGSTGFLGQHLCNSLAADDVEVVALEHNEVSVNPHGDLTAVRGDVRDLAFLRQVISRYEVDIVFHLAAQTQVSVLHGNPTDAFDTNVRGTWTVLEACRLERVRRVVVASSDKVYGECQDATEDLPLVGTCPYSVSKVCVDRLATSYGINYDLPVAVVRCGNLYGPGDTNFRRLVPGAIRAALRGEAFKLRTDGSGVRDYLYVDDAVVAYRWLAESDNVGPFNFSGGEPASANDVFTMLEKVIYTDGRSVAVDLGTDTTELRHQTLCCDKARKHLAWTPRVNFDQGLREAVEWYRRNL